MDDEIITRAALMGPYEHPYRDELGQVWKGPKMRATWRLSGFGAAAGVALCLLTWDPFPLWLVGIAVAWWVLVWLCRLAEAASMIADITESWDQETVLGTVRARREHAGERDPELVHDEFAVTAEDAGDLCIWRFTPLTVGEDAPFDSTVVPGRPRYAASIVEMHPFDGADTAHAAEQLAEVQELAATLEREAAQAANARFEAQDHERAVAAETSSTAEALQHVTGQRSAGD